MDTATETESETKKLCMICSATFAGDDHKCPDDVARRHCIEQWACHIQCTATNRGKGWGKAAALKVAREAFPSITPEHITQIADGSIEWTTLESMFDPNTAVNQ